MTRTRRTPALTAGALGCFGGAPAAAPTADADAPTPAPTTTAEPVDPLTTVVALVARPEGLELRDADGAVVEVLDYVSAPVDALAALTTVFGAAPASQEYQGSNHFPPSTAHRWGGFELWEQRYVDRWEGPAGEVSIERPAFMVRFTSTSVGDLSLTTSDARHVGDSWDDLLATPGLLQNPSGCSGPYLDYVELPRVDPDGSPYTLTVSVDFRPSEDESRIARIGSPVPVYDGCA